MIVKEIPYFNLKQIADSGQCFRWKELENNKYRIIALGSFVDAWQDGENVYFSCDEDEFEKVWHKYFDLDTDYAAIIAGIDENDKFLNKAAKYASGIRILNQELWEMIISFIISQNNNIPRIKNSIEKICAGFGKMLIEGEYSFPSFAELKNVDIDMLADMGLGYRDRYLADACKIVYEEVAERISYMDYEAAMKYLMSFNGIGRKVANCICLFGLHKVEACPVDTWIQKIIDEEYDGVMPAWMKSEYAGIYQQYAFYYKRTISGKA